MRSELDIKKEIWLLLSGVFGLGFAAVAAGGSGGAGDSSGSGDGGASGGAPGGW